jgi:lipopolysaccharide transport system permease protein
MATTEDLAYAGGVAVADNRVTVIRPTRGWAWPNLRELWDHREILYFLVWRDVKIRYKQTTIGAAWVLLQPLLTATIFTVVFGRFADLPSGGVPYAVMVYAALLPWFLFANALSTSTRSIVDNQALVTKVYMPRLFLPLAAVLSGLVDFVIGGAFLVGLMAWYGIVPPLQALLLPVLVLLLVATSVAVTLWLAALNVRYRDVQYTVPFLTQAWLFATPVAYSALVFPESLRQWIGLNPMAGVIQGFRWALIPGEGGPVALPVLLTLGIVLVLLVAGSEYFRRVERSFADEV